MKRLFITLSILSLILLLTPIHFSQAAELADRLKGKILLQVEDKGKAYYVDPTTKQRAYLGYPADAFRIMRELGLGIKHVELQSYLDTQFPKRLSGKILLDVESRGEAYYVFPDDLKGYYLGKPADAFRVMREKGLGIKNEDLAEVPVFQKYKEKVEQLAKKIEQIEGGGQILGEKVKKQSDVISKQQEQIIDLQKRVEGLVKQPEPTPAQVAAPTCTSWAYSGWSPCSQSGQQIRTTISSSPSNCHGGSPILSQSCTFTPSTCTSWSYSEWSSCSQNGQQTRSIITSSPSNCVGGSHVLTQSCSFIAPACNSWVYSDWGACSQSGQQTRAIVSSLPNSCLGGNPALTQNCVYTPVCSCSDIGKNCCTSCTVGDTCGGGILMSTNPNLVSAPADCTNTNTCPIQESLYKNWSLAVNTCQNLSTNNYDDWYLPTLDELNILYAYRISHILYDNDWSFMVNANYWSSTPYDNNASYAWLKNFSTKEENTERGSSVVALKSGTWSARCVRKLN